jgi:hypothetical protein
MPYTLASVPYLLAKPWQDLSQLLVADALQHCILCQLQSALCSMFGCSIDPYRHRSHLTRCWTDKMSASVVISA